MTRFPDWEARLGAYLETLVGRPFVWGSHDCCTFCAGAVFAMTGEDAMAQFRGTYTSEREAGEVLNTIGGGSLTATLDAKFQRVSRARAHRADLVLTEFGLGLAHGLVSIHVGQQGERQGLIQRPRSSWLRAWAVPMPGSA